jgi:tRNA threonylcarbamoyl adenosine modification protein YeaZ
MDFVHNEIRNAARDRDMKILALELSSARGSMAWRDGDVDLAREWPNDRKHSGTFFENLADVQKQFGAADKIIVGLGPGSYAGTRIAISAAIGLSFGGTTSVSSQNLGRDRARPSIELIGYPSICAFEDASDYCVIGDARRQSFFFARIRENNLVEGPDLLSESELRAKIDKEKMSIFATEELPQFERVQIRYPSARVLARLAADTNRAFVQPPLEPMYLREPHITTPRST